METLPGWAKLLIVLALVPVGVWLRGLVKRYRCFDRLLTQPVSARQHIRRPVSNKEWP